MSARPRSLRRPVSYGAVTIATNMAGRGTDIMLGGNADYMAKNDRKAGALRPMPRPPATPTTQLEEILDARGCSEARPAQGRARARGAAGGAVRYRHRAP